jgi:hypothetical protein
MSKKVREPIQVYLTPDERRVLDLAARELGVSRSEVLRRGLQTLGGSDDAGRAVWAGGSLEGAFTPATAGPGPPPPSRPMARLDDLLEELSEDRGDS